MLARSGPIERVIGIGGWLRDQNSGTVLYKLQVVVLAKVSSACVDNCFFNFHSGILQEVGTNIQEGLHNRIAITHTLYTIE
jgi:hypothetical protein